MDGYELAGQLRRLPGYDKVDFIALTGYGQEADRQRSLRAGFTLHLVKPVDLARLVEHLESVGCATVHA